MPSRQPAYHPKWLHLLGLVTVSLLIAWGLAVEPRPATGASADGSSEHMDPAGYWHLLAIREELCLTSRDLASMGCTQAAAEDLLVALRGWYTANRMRLERADQSVVAAERVVHELSSRIRLGSQSPSASRGLAGALGAVGTAKKSRREVIEEGAAAVGSLGGVAVWVTARANRGCDPRHRFVPDLTVTQQQRLGLVASKFGAASSHVAHAEQDVLTVAQRTAMSLALANERQHAAGVAAAEAAVLPRPIEVGGPSPLPGEQ